MSNMWDFVMEKVIPIVIILLVVFLVILIITATPHLISGEAFTCK